MTHALTLLLITLLFGRLASRIPMAVLAAILMIVAYHMSEWRTFLRELSSGWRDVVLLLTTFLLTLLVNLVVAIEVGMALSMLDALIARARRTTPPPPDPDAR
jgi:SulP family sulfate permease